MAVLSGLFITGFIWFLVWGVHMDEGFSNRVITGILIAPGAGFESWRQTVKLNLEGERKASQLRSWFIAMLVLYLCVLGIGLAMVLIL
jgi:hypothetical protein